MPSTKTIINSPFPESLALPPLSCTLAHVIIRQFRSASAHFPPSPRSKSRARRPQRQSRPPQAPAGLRWLGRGSAAIPDCEAKGAPGRLSQWAFLRAVNSESGRTLRAPRQPCGLVSARPQWRCPIKLFALLWWQSATKGR